MPLKLLSLPIGNPEDLTLRAKKVLNETGVFLSEDTRVFKDFLSRNGYPVKDKKIISFHDYSQSEIEKYVEIIKNEEIVYVVSDAGSPIISDPAFPLVRACLKNEIEIDTLPGVSAPLVLLELSGLPPIPFHFHGFLPREKGKIKSFFNGLTSEVGTHIFFESPRRINETLKIMSENLKDVDIAVGRELTKTFQSLYRFKIQDFEKIVSEKNWVQKGEFTVAVSIEKSSGKSHGRTQKLAEDCLSKKGHPKSVSKLVAEVLGLDQKEVYKQLSQ